MPENPNTPSERSDIISGTGTAALVDGEFIKREKNGRTYKIVTREYMATGHCGYTSFLGHKYLIGAENGQPMSSVVREYLLGGYRYTGRNDAHLTISLAGARRVNNNAHLREKNAVVNALQKLRSRAQDQDCFNITAQEHTNSVERYDGKQAQRGSWGNGKNGYDSEKTYREDLFVIHPVVDGRSKDVARG